MTDSNPSPSVHLEEWHCPGSRRIGSSRIGASAKCSQCGRRMAERHDGLIPKHPKPGMYHPNKQPKPPRSKPLEVIGDAYAEYEAALGRREHGGVAAARFIEAVAAALNGGDA